MKDFCSLCYGRIAADDDGIKCQRCGSSFDADGNVIEQRNDFMAQAVIDATGVTTQEQAQRVAMRDLKTRVRIEGLDGSVRYVDALPKEIVILEAGENATVEDLEPNRLHPSQIALRRIRDRANSPGTVAQHGRAYADGMRCAANILEGLINGT